MNYCPGGEIIIHYSITIWALIANFLNRAEKKSIHPWPWLLAPIVGQHQRGNVPSTKSFQPLEKVSLPYSRRVLGITSGIENIGGMQWELLGTLFLGWTTVYLIIWKGLHSSGKVRTVLGSFSFITPQGPLIQLTAWSRFFRPFRSDRTRSLSKVKSKLGPT